MNDLQKKFLTKVLTFKMDLFVTYCVGLQLRCFHMVIYLFNTPLRQWQNFQFEIFVPVIAKNVS